MTSPPIGPPRLATRADIPRLVEIRTIVQENRLRTPELVTPADYEWFVEHGPIWVADGVSSASESPVILGFAAGDPRDGTVWALFVDPLAEGRGIGRSLLARVCETLRDQGHTRAALTTAPGTRAARLYRSLGWTETGTTRSGELCFSLALT